MIFKTKFDLGDIVWLMKDNKPTKVMISSIEVFYVNTNQDKIIYNAIDFINPVTWLDHTNLREEMLYISKNDLIKQL